MTFFQKRFSLLVTITLLFAGAVFLYHTYQQTFDEPLTAEPVVTYEPTNNRTQTLQQIIHEAQKNVVKISVETPTSTRVGSGFLYNNRGDIITNAHVIENASVVEVTLSTTETYPAAIVGMSKEKDIAVIRVPQLINQRPMTIDTTQSIDIGTDILALGSPLGYQNSVSVGIISGTNRSFDIDGYSYDEVYQISSNITHGNSGGPLIDQTTGKVIGINSAGISDTDIGFSIPIKDVIDEVTDWSANTSNDALTFPSTIHNQLTSIDDYKEDSYYLVQYFIDSLAIHDYINAYALLGSDYQSNHNYTDFREHYISLKTIDLIEQQQAAVEDDQWAFTVLVEEFRAEQEPETDTYTFKVGLENDQLKIIAYTNNHDEA
ncbi:Trypsin-like peptidase domain-containing protein [Halolactibacillus halophilus]|uniref:Peptidase S1 n=1 Tax=Halolactibacillus halophilus TaxID=306540 RepID=A0A1I5N8Y4_9BACI|nr:trypsin-like peptidase domain-containing protein [Halolactibacillus halophilus]GEM01200.1 peptidase S1 [Halolactibacillus halophilus]SFP17816.1 Trypsin-like peptidase domain-containing protein [Halolactibacillus halophilus]